MNAIVPAGIAKAAAGLGGSLALKLRHIGPHAMLVGGIAGVIAGAVWACIKTPEAIELGNEIKDDLDEARDRGASGREMAGLYIKSIARMGMHYAPCAILGLGGLGLVVGSHIMLANSLSAAAMTAQTTLGAYRKYRQNIRDTYGEEADEMALHGVSKTQEEVYEEGKKRPILIDKWKADQERDASIYSVWFDEFCRGWEDAPYNNEQFLTEAEAYFQRVLDNRGYLFLDEVYKYLGINARSEQWAMARQVGWLKEKYFNPYTNCWDYRTNGDGYVSLGISNLMHHDFWSEYGVPKPILLDPNVDGIILHDIRRWKEN